MEPATIFGRRRIRVPRGARGDMTCHFILAVPAESTWRRAPADPAAGACGASTLALDARLRARTRACPAAAGRGRRTAMTPESSTRQPIPRPCRAPSPAPSAIRPSETRRWTRRTTLRARFWTCSPISSGGARWTENGATLVITVHYGVDYDNAFWDGAQLVFGDGDGLVFDRFTKPARRHVPRVHPRGHPVQREPHLPGPVGRPQRERRATSSPP